MTLIEFKKTLNLDFSISGLLTFSTIKNLCKLKIDMNVWLPSISKNLQREYCWNQRQEKELILSILLDRHIPPIQYIETADSTIQIIDGKQRLTAILRFLNNDFFITIGNEKYYYKDLPNDFKLEFDYYSIPCHCYHEYKKNKLTDIQKIQWFLRVNFSGTTLEKEKQNYWLKILNKINLKK